ncbi:trans-2,3-dihydro-3-hydroxyanthranilate isomerase [Bradyrhizobium elkanii]|jgi:trans-2,3-dihydro-3-hydroxyanthranilate isomerase|uniref:PhzF family phenazine biosynthesis protein n=1 Tax=Bradyrhizobium TaxID=374 RepID=UPI001448FDB5|nr:MULTISPECIES: PhzF family phenazine biosynthesis protein [Bradyrhizobium]MBP2434554.1 trans-2,3-dihydro-3-hydroxyanthranilate isomerase [Bradyrhizobium elkanii]MCP1932981.1 trans-2,3-dihydro-3-hydroxyanthranilate isomerase [Bradyrhizobium elkanii]MCP1968788.1 trans-2,3-dihydro-3-hydroxyanthranilate isomerase [Bradyrhizobium elkanii]MCS3479007.1 trans-2,3-dihydro-3-hydroxyanthranilate isomerase [Bradyrhizobium elkanii]MCS3524875.1 trans-2,3-dihydro-3-hydroxyanthranilate isomerase [Bradyrhizo
MQRRYITVDVFTDRAFGGNPLGVVLDAEGLSTEEMQAIATEFNYSETTFVLPPQDKANDAQVRIFTVRSEIPFAGHPNVGTAFVLASRAAKAPARLRFEEKAGLVPVEILSDGGNVIGAELTAPQALQRTNEVSAAAAAACLSLTAADVKTDRHAPQVVSVGLPFLVVEIASREALKRARPDATAFARTLAEIGRDVVYFYTRDVPASEQPLDLQARMFHPGASGLSEDPATGSATAACAALLADIDPISDGELRLRIGQGVDMGRPSLLLTRVRKQAGAITSVHVGGGCVKMMEGTLNVPGEAG